MQELPGEDDGGKEACGVFGVYALGEDVARLTFYGLYALQHRGQESAGIATSDGAALHVRTGMGLVAQVFDEADLGFLPGHIAIGHTRYSTTGSSRICNAQPIHLRGPGGQLALGHNGNLVNAEFLRDELEAQNVEFSSGTDSEVIAHMLITSSELTWERRLQAVMRRLEGAYSLVILTPSSLIAARDPMGNRPLCLGRIGEGWVVASETCALDHLGARFVREVLPGEVVTIDHRGMRSLQAVESKREAFCIFEYIYFARPDSIMRGERIYPIRMAMGRELAREFPVEADVVIGIPDSATAAAIGYARESGIPYVEGLMKNRYVGRTFIKPDQRIREAGVHLKFNPLREALDGQRVVVVDDSIVRATTTPRVVKMLRDAGAAEVHMRICAPPIKHQCYFGVDMASRSELIAANMTVPEIERHIGVDSLGYLSLEGLMRAIDMGDSGFCMACFTGEYPIPVQLALDKLSLERPERLIQIQTLTHA
ncbi:MAG: amidophosphoribosyltransferase [Chloroflexi bacterium]|nr:amidophosphoribosyltransferase [Chloroflexota bacterium]